MTPTVTLLWCWTQNMPTVYPQDQHSETLPQVCAYVSFSQAFGMVRTAPFAIYINVSALLSSGKSKIINVSEHYSSWIFFASTRKQDYFTAFSLSHLIVNSGYQLFNWYVSGEVESSSLILMCMSFQVKAALDIVSERLSAFTDVGNSCSHAEHILKDLVNFEEKSCVRTALLHISSMTVCVCVCV